MFRSAVQICLEVILSIHGVFQKVARRNKRVQFIIQQPIGEIFLGLFTLTLSLCCCSILGAILMSLMIYRYGVSKYLQHLHGQDFVGLMDGADSLWATEDESRGIVNGLMVIESSLDPETFYHQMKNRLCNTLLRHDKFRYIRGRYGGFLYYLRNQVNDEDIVKRLPAVPEKKELNKDELMIWLSKFCNEPLPYNDTGTNEILIGVQAVKWRKNDNSLFQYPVLYRLHHCIGDGISVQQLITRRLADEDVTTVISKLVKNAKRSADKENKSITNIVADVQHGISKILKLLMKIMRLSAHRLSYLEPAERNILHGQKLSGKKHFACCVEDQPELLSMIKDVKKSINGVGFSDIVVAAVAESFSDYIQQVCAADAVPEHITAAITVLPPNEKIELNSPKIRTHNRFSLALAALPVRRKEKDILDTVQFLKNEFFAMRNSVDVVWNYWQMKYAFGLLPVPVIRNLMTKADSTIALSNLPGTDLLTVLNGCNVIEFIFWIPNKAIVGIGISVYTYDNRIQLGILADENVLPSYGAAKKILENVFTKIKQIYIASKDL